MTKAKYRSVSMLEVIERIPSRLKDILASKDRISTFINSHIEKINAITEIVIVASGSSLTASKTASRSIEKYSNKRVTLISSNEFVHDCFVYPTDALYLFISQTGNSKTTRLGQQKMKNLERFTLAITESDDSKLAQECTNHLILGSGQEEYGQRTIGYTTTVFTLTLLGIEIGNAINVLSNEETEELYRNACKSINRHKDVTDRMNGWITFNKRNLLKADTVVFVGSNDLIGLAYEGSVKLWETPQIPSFGYEVEEAMHGINYGMDAKYSIIVFEGLNSNKQMTNNFVAWLRDCYKNVIYLGSDATGDYNFTIESQDETFRFIEYSAAIQVINYRLAVDGGRDLMKVDVHEVMNSYFAMHDES